MKKLPVPTIAAAVLVFAAGGLLFFKYSEKGASQLLGRDQKIRIANVGQYSILNLIAKDKGFFKDNGLDAEITEYDTGATSVGALRKGDADVAVAANFVGVTNLFFDKNLRVLAEVGNQNNFFLLARKDKGISTPADLRGKKIGATFRTAGQLYLGRFLQANGMTMNDVDAVDRTPAQMRQELQGGQLDAILIFDPHAYDLESALDGKIVFWSAQGNQRAYALAYSTKDFVETHPDAVRRYVRSLLSAETYLHEHREEAMRFVGDALHYDNAYLQYMWKNSEFGVKLDEDMLVAMEEQARWVIETGMTDQKAVPNYLSFIDFPALESIDPSLVNIVH